MGGPKAIAAIKGVSVFMIIPAPRPALMRFLLMPILLGCGSLPTIAMAQSEASAKTTQQESDQIGFSAEVVEYDSNTEVVTAKGNVIANRDGYSVRADKIVWNRSTGQVVAEGNIRTGYENFRVQVQVTYSGDVAPRSGSVSDSKKVVLTITQPNGEALDFTFHRANY